MTSVILHIDHGSQMTDERREKTEKKPGRVEAPQKVRKNKDVRWRMTDHGWQMTDDRRQKEETKTGRGEAPPR